MGFLAHRKFPQSLHINQTTLLQYSQTNLPWISLTFTLFSLLISTFSIILKPSDLKQKTLRTDYHVDCHSREAWRSTSKKSQLYTINRHPSVPSWEKKFCFEVGSMPWKRLLESQKFISQSDKVIQWNDVACEKAFHDAKSRFWAMINGLPCKTSLPDPDMYIDKIDWNAKVDPELLSGLEVTIDEVEENEEDNVSDSLCITFHQIKPTGWDVVYSEEVQKPKLLTGVIVGDETNCSKKFSDFQDDREVIDKTWENSRNMYDSGNFQGNGICASLKYKTWENLDSGSRDGDNNYVGEGFIKLKANYKKRIDGDHSSSSKYTKSRFHNDGNQRSCRWKY